MLEGKDGSGPRNCARAIAAAPFGRAVGFLLSQTGDATSRRFKTGLAELDIEPRHFAVLRAIEAAENRSQQSLAGTLHIPPSSMVALLDQLEARQLVARHLDATDRRVHIVEMTDDGRALLEQAMEVAVHLEMQVSAGLDLDQRELMIEMLQLVASNLGLWAGVHGGLADPHGEAGSAPAGS